MAAWTERRGEAAGQTFGLLKGPWPVNWFEAEAQAFVQVSEKLVGSVLGSQEHVEDLYTSQV